MTNTVIFHHCDVLFFFFREGRKINNDIYKYTMDWVAMSSQTKITISKVTINNNIDYLHIFS